MTIQPFTIAVPQATLDDLRERLARTRWTDAVADSSWEHGISLEYMHELIDAHPEQDPLKLSFPKLHKLITELEDFGDDPEKSSEAILESIQMAWYEEVK